MLTPIDHWLRDKFLLQTHIYTLRLPEKLPKGVKVNELPESPSNRYRYRLIADTNKKTDNLITKLGEAGMMFKTQVVEQKCLLKPLIAPKKGGVLLNVFWLFSMVGLVFGITRVYGMLASDPVFVENLQDAMALFTSS